MNRVIQWSCGVWLAFILNGAAHADPLLPTIPATNFNVTSFGALGDGVSNNTVAIQNTINAAAAAGGGTVEIPAGTYLSGPLTLASKINVQIDAGATLKMLPFATYTNYPPNGGQLNGNLLYASGVTNVEISGSGTIDGNGAAWWTDFALNPSPDIRPYMVYFNGGCSKVLIHNTTLQNPPKMHIVFKGVDDNITIQDILINTTDDNAANTDGIDLLGTHCLVRHCTINSGDDNIALGSSGSNSVSTDILITNCVFGVGHGVSIGSNTAGGVSNLTVMACTFDGTDYGIRMKSDNLTSGGSGQGGVTENLLYSNITMTNIVRGAIVIYSYYKEFGTPTSITPFGASTQAVGSVLFPIWRNITFSNVSAVVTGGVAGMIWGRKEMIVTNVTLSKVNITGPSRPFAIYNARGIQIIDSQFNIPVTTNNLNLYNAEVTVTNSTVNTNLVRLGGLATPLTNNTVALFNAQAAITDTNMLGTAAITMGGSTLTFTPSAVSFSNNFSVAASSTLIFSNGNCTLGGALNGGILAVVLTNTGNLRLDQGANVWGGTNAVFDAGASGVINNHSAGNISIFLGALAGSTGSQLQGSDQAGPAVDTYVIGNLNSNTTFAGVITNGTSGGTPHTVALTKVGTGTFTLSGASGVFGSATVSNGTLVVTNSSLSLSGGFQLGGGTAIVRAAGSLAVTNASNTGSIDVRTGAMTITGGVVLVDQLFVTNGVAGQFELKGGTLTPGSSVVGGAVQFVVGSVPMVATLNISRGTHSFGNDLVVAGTAGSTGTLWLTGGSLAVTNASIELRLGNNGGTAQLIMSNGTLRTRFFTVGGPFSTGTFTMAGGTNLASLSTFVGDSFNATGTVWMTGGEFDNTNNSVTTYIGTLCPGQMTVSNGLVRAYNVVAGTGANGVGRLNLFGGTETISSSLVLGDCGDGSIGLVNVGGGNLHVTNAAHTAMLDVRNGTLTLSSGTLRADILIITNACGHFVKTGGTLSITTTNITASLDADGDGYSNQQEAFGGSDPFNPASTPPPQFITSWNTNASGKWETDTNWTAGAPSQLFTNVYVTNTTTKVVTIDATTTNTPATMTISNLTVAGPTGTINTLSLSNAGTVTPLRILNGATINGGGAWLVTNSSVRVDGGTLVVSAATQNASLTILANGTVATTGPVTLSGGANSTGIVVVAGGQLVVTNTPGTIGIGGGFVVDGSVSLTNGSSIIVSNGNTVIGNVGSGSLTMFGGLMSAPNLTVGSFNGSAGLLTIAGGTNVCTSGLLIGELAGATGAVWITGGSLDLTSLPGASVTVGRDGTGQLTLSNGTIVGASFSSMTVGTANGSAGTLTVVGGTITGQIGFLIGGNGGATTATGTVWLVGGQITATNGVTVGNSAVGRMIVSNAVVTLGSPVIGLLATGRGTLTVAGGTVTVVGSPTGIIVGSGSTGTVWLLDGQITVTNAFSTIGNFGSGQMTVSNGVLTMGNFSVGNSAGSRGTLTVAGGILAAQGFMTVGSASTGTAWLVGGQTVATNGTTTIGSSGSGQMTVSNAVVTLSNVVMGASFGGRGTLTAAAGTNSVYGGITVGNFACTAVGTITVAGGGLFVTNAAHTAVLDVRSGSLILNSGTLTIDKLVITNVCGHFVRTGGTLSITTTDLAPSLDADGDGIPNAFDLNPLNPADAGADPDGDGFSNLQEYLAGTDPTNSASALRITSIARVANTNILVTWTMGSGKTNALQRTAGDANGSYVTNGFSDIFTVTNTAGATTNYLDVGAATNFPSRYYRIRLVP